ncbi:threonine--tRNA ligase [Streptomyces sp. NPDC021093]|uniref:threonine--tRNA ligase n=1 Tax=Streptomyces sp. NPDC021093 TaxID=3365112 RepID=UPI00379473EB
MSDVRVFIQRDSEREERVVTTGTTAAELFAGERSIVAARVAGELKDLSYEVVDGEEVEPVEITSEDGLSILRHSTAHVMAQAVQELFPEAKLGIGPPIKDGFYYDFDVEKPFTPEDLKAIEKQMQVIQKRGQKFSRRVTTDEAAQVELADEPYKLELIGLKGNAAQAADGADAEVGAGELTIYDNLDAKTGELCWSDLCRGPHLPTTRNIPVFKLMRSAAAYWRGSEKNKQLQRIYGTAWPTKDELKAYLEFLAEAEKRDHRKLGAELDLFSFPEEIGPGLAVFHPKGGIIRREMESYSRKRHEDENYEFVNTPHISKEKLFETSGHLPNYADGMFPPVQFDEQNYRLKAMNCPMHNLIFKARGRSYRELPLRLFEFGTVYRYEKSGVVHGLTRSRGFTQDDSHIYCTKEQMPSELDSLLTFVLDLLRDYGLTDFELELSTRDPESDKFIGEDAEWEEATEALRLAAEKQGLPLVPDPGGAAFYGPKISVQVRDAIGRSWQMSTIQVDFQQPARFGLEYTSADGTKQQPVMIHRALFGSIERFFGVLLEHYAGAFPVWLAPVQAVGIPIGDGHVPYLQEFAAEAKKKGLRVEVDSSSDRMQKKIRTHQKSKVPFMILVGDEDMAAGTVSFRYRDGSQENGIPRDQALAKLVDVVERRVQV